MVCCGLRCKRRRRHSHGTVHQLQAQRLVQVDDVEYLSIVDWEVHQRVGKRARRRYPALPSAGESEADEGLGTPIATPDDSNPSKSPDPPPAAEAAADAAWHEAIDAALRRVWGADVPAGVAFHAARWRAEGRDLARDVLPAIDRVVRVAVDLNQPLRLELVDGAMAVTPPPLAA